MDRRGFLAGLGALIAAPAIVRASSLMPVRRLPLLGRVTLHVDKVLYVRFPDGSPERPFRTIQGAMRAAQNLRSSIPIIQLASGEYEVATTAASDLDLKNVTLLGAGSERTRVIFT
jgi:Protein of unknown function (DUF1565)